jgi:hypothetical protein
MTIGVAGPYSHPTEEGRLKNLETLNRAAAAVFERGHVPLIGVNAALEVLRYAKFDDYREAMMKISLEVIARCDALYFIGESPGANRERDLAVQKGIPVYYRIDEIPEAT